MRPGAPTPDFAARLLSLIGSGRARVAIAFSGGIDSTVLADVLAQQRRRFGNLRLLHVDHGMQPASVAWARHCAAQARRWKLPLNVLRTRVTVARGESPEAAAREARYALLAAALDAGEVLVTAQHRDDQVETLLLQLFRGAGLAGLAGMPAIAPFGPGRIARPLLEISRDDIEQYARARKLRWIEDPTNAQPHFARNYLRNEVMPGIRLRWPGVDVAIARSAGHAATAQVLLADVARGDLERAADGAGLNVAALRALSPARRRNALRVFLAREGVEAPSTARLAEIAGPLLAARADANPEVRLSGALLRRRGGRLELQAGSEHRPARVAETPSKSWRWNEDRELRVSKSAGVLKLVDDPAGPIDLERLPNLLRVRGRQGGETLRPGARQRRQSLKKLLQAARIAPELRARMPLVFAPDDDDGRLIAAADRWIDASVAANVKSRRRARLVWRP
jgi:tRNA(Ile)-lysidine synthase